MRLSSALLFAILLLPTPPVLADAPPTLEEKMTEEEFKASGLDKLSPEELANLNAWLNRRTVAVNTAATPVDNRGFLQSSGSAIVTRFVGEFKGWDEDTKFVLENGHIWEVIDVGVNAHLAGVRRTNPVITIEPGMMNSWFLSVEGTNKKVRVRRVK